MIHATTPRPGAIGGTALSADEPQTRHVPIVGGELFVRCLGGPEARDTVVLIHGGPGISHRYMLGLERLAGAQRQVVSYDQRGVGRLAVRERGCRRLWS